MTLASLWVGGDPRSEVRCEEADAPREARARGEWWRDPEGARGRDRRAGSTAERCRARGDVALRLGAEKARRASPTRISLGGGGPGPWLCRRRRGRIGKQLPSSPRRG